MYTFSLKIHAYQPADFNHCRKLTHVGSMIGFGDTNFSFKLFKSITTKLYKVLGWPYVSFVWIKHSNLPQYFE